MINLCFRQAAFTGTLHWLVRVIVLAIFIGLLNGCSEPTPVKQLSGAAQGTTWHVTVWHPEGLDITALQSKIDAEFNRLDQVLSNYRQDSVIERFNQSASIAPVDVGNEIADLVQIAKEVSRASQGCYDLTIKPLFDLWGFSGESVSLPGSAELEQVRKLTGFGLVSVPTLTELQKNAPEAEIDLSSIAQGYSVDRVASVIEAAGIKNYLVEIGGELKTRGHKPDGSFWRIAIERPLPGGRAVQKVLTIGQDEPVSVMTSGTYRHYFDDQGTRYSHVLDARTGKPITHKTVSVTVLDQDPTLADAWSTALLCLGDEEGLTIANQAGIAALFLRESGEQFVEKTTSAWRSMKNIEVQ